MSNSADIKTLIREQLPSILAEDASIRDFILRTVSEYYSPKQETDQKFEEFFARVDRILDQLERDREEQARKWDEQRQLSQENDRKWAEQRQLWDEQRQLSQENDRKWAEQRQLWDEQRQLSQENDRKWAEQRQLWDEQRQLSQENDRKWDEQRQLSQENDRKWAEQRQLWDEQRQLSQENDRKWAEQKQLWDEQRQLSQENDRKWAEQKQLWEENHRKWEEEKRENDRKWRETFEEIKLMNRKHDSTIGALGSRWGLFSEASFRNALAGILEDSFGVEVLNINDYDPDGMVFGRPDQVEIDVIIKNGVVIICEIKSSIGKAEMYIFDRKVEFYQQKYQRSVNRKIVISPMVDPNALPVAESLGIEVYSYAEDVSVK